MELKKYFKHLLQTKKSCNFIMNYMKVLVFFCFCIILFT